MRWKFVLILFFFGINLFRSLFQIETVTKFVDKCKCEPVSSSFFMCMWTRLKVDSFCFVQIMKVIGFLKRESATVLSEQLYTDFVNADALLKTRWNQFNVSNKEGKCSVFICYYSLLTKRRIEIWLRFHRNDEIKGNFNIDITCSESDVWREHLRSLQTFYISTYLIIITTSLLRVRLLIVVACVTFSHSNSYPWNNFTFWKFCCSSCAYSKLRVRHSSESTFYNFDFYKTNTTTTSLLVCDQMIWYCYNKREWWWMGGFIGNKENQITPTPPPTEPTPPTVPPITPQREHPCPPQVQTSCANKELECRSQCSEPFFWWESLSWLRSD
jgi:hypothetical protein